MQHVKHSMDPDGFLGMGGLVDQIVHDGLMDERHLDQILFSSHAGSTVNWPEERPRDSGAPAPICHDNRWIADAPLPPDDDFDRLNTSMDTSFTDQGTSQQHYNQQISLQAPNHCRFGTGHSNRNPFQGYPSHRFSAFPQNQTPPCGGSGFPPNTQRTMATQSSPQACTYMQHQPRTCTDPPSSSLLASSHPETKKERESEVCLLHGFLLLFFLLSNSSKLFLQFVSVRISECF
ncbi:hypothetical protein GCK32_017123, partial [Trichostrongylus colubriformis]